MEPLVVEDRVISRGYPNGRLRFAQGRFVRYGGDDMLVGAALLEIHDGNDRLMLDHGVGGRFAIPVGIRRWAVRGFQWIAASMGQLFRLPFPIQ